MSLRAFHLFFIALSVILAAFMAAWAIGQYRSEHHTGYALTGVVSLAGGVGLAFYGAAFQENEASVKTMLRGSLSAVLLLAAPGVALACPVCFGQNDSPLANAMNMGILLMLGVVFGVLACFATFFIHLMRRAKQAETAAQADTGHYLEGQEGTVQC